MYLTALSGITIRSFTVVLLRGRARVSLVRRRAGGYEFFYAPRVPPPRGLSCRRTRPQLLGRGAGARRHAAGALAAGAAARRRARASALRARPGRRRADGGGAAALALLRGAAC